MWHKKLMWMCMDTKYGGVEWRQSLTLQALKHINFYYVFS